MTQPQEFPMQPGGTHALAAPLPDYLLQLGQKDSDYWQDMGDIEPADFGLNFLKIVQGMSKQAKAGWGPTGQEPAMPQGSYFLDKTGVVIPEGTDFIPLLRSVTYIKFKGKNTREGIEFLTKDRNDPRIRAIHGLDWTERNGDRIPPSVTKFVNFYVVTVYNLNEPAILSFHKTATKRGQQLTRDIATATTRGNVKLPQYICKFKLTRPAIEKDGGNEWFQIRYEANGYIKQENIEKLKRLHDLAQTLEQASRGIGVTDEGVVVSTDTSAEPAPSMGRGTIIDVPTTPVVSSQAPQEMPAPQPVPQPVAQAATPEPVATPTAPAPLITPVAPPVQVPAPQTAAQAPAPAATIAGW